MNDRHSILNKIATSHVRPFIVGIDGCSGAGKTTLARWLHDHLDNATIIHKDDFYSTQNKETMATYDPEQGYFRYFDLDRLEEQVFIPLSKGAPFEYQVYDWSTGQLGVTKSVAPNRGIIVDGCYATRPELRSYYDLCIWVETSADTRLKRQAARNENRPEWRARWTAAENYYMEHYRHNMIDHMIIAGE